MDITHLFVHTNETTFLQVTLTVILAKLGQPYMFARSLLQVFMLLQALFVQDLALFVRSISLFVLIPRYVGLVLLLESISFFEHWFQMWPYTHSVITHVVKFVFPCMNIAFPACLLIQINTIYETMGLWALIAYECVNVAQRCRHRIHRELLLEPYH